MAHEKIRGRASALGFDPFVALGVAEQESGGGHNVYGDPTEDPRGLLGPDGRRYASLGPFQENIVGGAGESHLNRGGLLADLFDPVSATDRFVDRFRWAEGSAFTGETAGEIAARAQRPADPSGYARSVDALISGLRGTSSTEPRDAHDTGAVPTSGGECPRGQYRNVFGVCVAGSGGFVPGQTTGPLPTAPGAGKPLTGTQPFDPLGGVAAAIEGARQGAAQLAVATAVIGVAGILAYGGLRKMLG